ncbi:C2H2-type zinc finger transcription factor [Mucor lusitanicus]|uniref:C2H2-type zinc finger transcription factor n=2 Tax=Mucor circinelloides f. lusitanicus TaxID=29924 RepID=A0A168L4N2_MUCCL|nr:C2H2-type zinc finger transcription factor [Mucor lusitanicus]OAD03106.1 C2H2-type zinc finger transcription factor [Mucor lusitanicus CBS 277.49]
MAAAKKKQLAKKEVLTFTYPCYICGNILSKARQVVNHVETIHGYKLPVRQVGHKRPQEPHYEYNNDPATVDDYDVSHYACASCWFHCPEAGLKELSDHVNSVHHPENVAPEKNKHGEIKGGEVTDSDITNSLNQAKHSANRAEGIEGGEDDKDGEDQVMAESSDKKAKKDDNKDMGDIYQKLNELVDMFQRVLKGNDLKD